MKGAVCENCGKGTMRRFAQDTFYWYLKCTNKPCQKERLELRPVMEKCPYHDTKACVFPYAPKKECIVGNDTVCHGTGYVSRSIGTEKVVNAVNSVNQG